MSHMKRYLLGTLMTFMIASCGGNSSALTSLPFVDTFDRANTSSGLGTGWDLHGAYVDKFPLPPATDGFLKGGHFTYAGNSTVYAARQFNGTVRRLGTEGYWQQIREGGETSIAMAISASDLLVTDMVHFAANRSVWDLTVRRGNGGFEPVASGKFNPTLKLGQKYEFEIQVTDSTITVKAPNTEVTHPIETTGLIGPHAFWEEFPNGGRAGTVFNFDSIWAAATTKD